MNIELNKKKEIINKYNSSSDYYDNRYKKIQVKKYEIGFRDILLEEKFIFDAGCGTGLLMDYFNNIRQERDWRQIVYVGVDISKEMLQKFREKRRTYEEKINSNFILADIDNLPIRESKFNLVLSFTALQNVPNLKSVIQELYEVSKNDATMVLSILKKNFNENDLRKILEPKFTNLLIEYHEKVEDVVIKGSIAK